MRSIRRSGVATMISTPRSISTTCLWRSAPPYTASTRMPHSLPIGPSTSETCNASSRVGTSTSPWGFPEAAGEEIFDIIGTPNASVFPEPVRARPHTSWPASATGIASVWMANGPANPAAASPASMLAGTPRSANPVGVVTVVAGVESCGGVVTSAVTLPTNSEHGRDSQK